MTYLPLGGPPHGHPAADRAVAAPPRTARGLATLLLESGADPNARDEIQDSAFLYAGAEGVDEILKLTLEHGADVRSTNRYGGPL
ncbi:hypothetical protein ACH4VM_23295 [Streptomyces sp. NPDC020792]|uniref:hypothetical protein n=1 Tax=Streptomyces sp. NPDC020792 TaxID=3365089 RepID=UPI0037B76E92